LTKFKEKRRRCNCHLFRDSTQVGVEKRAIKEENQTDIKPDRITIHMPP
jgi:hypothetical protein